jgi:hypothetical protein
MRFVLDLVSDPVCSNYSASVTEVAMYIGESRQVAQAVARRRSRR